MNDNPYAADDVVDDSPTDYWVDGDHVVVRSGTKLPTRCVFTGEETHGRGRVRRTLVWRGAFLSFFSKRCRLTFFVSGKTRYRLYATYVALFVILGGLAGIGVAQGAGYGATVATVVGLFVIAFGIWLNGRRAEFVVSAEREGWYWVYGFDREFLTRVKANGHRQSPESDGVDR